MMIKKDVNNGLQALADVGLPNGKTDLVELEQFTFDKFYKIYQTICPRSSIVNKTGNRDINIFMNYFFTDFTSLHPEGPSIYYVIKIWGPE